MPAAARRAASPGATLADLASWAAGAPVTADGDEVLIDSPAALDGVLNLRVAGQGGRPDVVSAWYARDAGPLLAEAARVLGAWTEFPRPATGPFEGEFASPEAPEGWRIVGSLYAPPDAGAGRRLVELAVVRA